MLKLVNQSADGALYQVKHAGKLNVFIGSTPETRAICNDPAVAGIRYTRHLAKACTEIFKLKSFDLKENETSVVNILRGGLNFGLRYVLADAFGWNNHLVSFVSAQRVRREDNPELWDITENAYHKMSLPQNASLVLGDVVATGTSLKYALDLILDYAVTEKIELKSLVFFTIGGNRATDLLEAFDAQCRKHFPNYESTNLIFLEGCFVVPTPDSHLSIRLTGTDLVRCNAIMAPEFIESQYENPTYPIERCVIYDAGSRAFCIDDYLEDVETYWQQNHQLAKRGVTFQQLLKERVPELDSSRFENVDLLQLSDFQINRIKQIKERN